MHLRYDEADLGTIFVYSARTGKFVCAAVCPERTGHDRAEIAAEVKARQKKRIAAEVKELKALAKEVMATDPIGEVLRERTEHASKLTVFPQESIEYETEAMREAAKVLEVLDAPAEAPHSQEVVAKGVAIFQQWLQAEQEVREESTDKYRRLYRAEERGDDLSPEDLTWMRGYEVQPAGIGMKIALDWDRAQRTAKQEQT